MRQQLRWRETLIWRLSLDLVEHMLLVLPFKSIRMRHDCQRFAKVGCTRSREVKLGCKNRLIPACGKNLLGSRKKRCTLLEQNDALVSVSETLTSGTGCSPLLFSECFCSECATAEMTSSSKSLCVTSTRAFDLIFRDFRFV